jgi:peptidoglycan/LPS O-acetylase OafA/YrhL
LPVASATERKDAQVPKTAAPGPVAIAEAHEATQHSAPRTTADLPRKRLAGLDGIRGLAALFVVVNHIFLRAFRGYPVNRAPFWAAPFIYGRFAVVVFIVLSGFSLTVAAARSGWRLDGLSRFAHSRAWRILPPYWAALVFSILMTWLVVSQPGWPLPNGKSVIVNGLLLQDVFDAPSPNRAFWSIAIEAQLYVVFPLLLLMIRRVSAIAMVTTVTLLVATVGVLGPHVALMSSLLTHYTPDLAVLFAIGVLAAGILTASERRRSWPWPWLAFAAAAPVLATITWKGSVWTIGHLFWVDLALGPAIGCLLAAVSTGRPKPLVSLLDTRPLRGLGSFSYSLYLTHMPIVIAVYYGLVAGRVRPGVPTFLVMLTIVMPVTIVFARLFAAVFEIPFQKYRGWEALRAALSRAARSPTPGRNAAAASPSSRPAVLPGGLGHCAPADQVGADLPEPGGGGLVIASLRQPLRQAVGEVLTRDVAEIVRGSQGDRGGGALLGTLHEPFRDRNEQPLKVAGGHGSERGAHDTRM